MSENEMGNKYTLWIAKYSLEAYVDQMGKKQNGYIVQEQVIVTVTEVRTDVRDMWTDEKRHKGIRAISDTGELFQCNWNVFPSDSMSPTFYWDAINFRNGERVQAIDAVQAYNSGISVYVYKNEKVKPVGNHIDYCVEHDKVYYVQGSERRFECWDCFMDTVRANNRR